MPTRDVNYLVDYELDILKNPIDIFKNKDKILILINYLYSKNPEFKLDYLISQKINRSKLDFFKYKNINIDINHFENNEEISFLDALNDTIHTIMKLIELKTEKNTIGDIAFYTDYLDFLQKVHDIVMVKTDRFAWMAAVARGNNKKGITTKITQSPSSHSPPSSHSSKSPPSPPSSQSPPSIQGPD